MIHGRYDGGFNMLGMTRQYLTALVLAAVVCQPAAANMRCGQYYIDSGERHGSGKYEVLKKCGEPKERMGNTWIYDNPKRVVRFNDSGSILSIDN
jgi:hypothetical protein